jgi:hypothetical protein
MQKRTSTPDYSHTVNWKKRREVLRCTLSGEKVRGLRGQKDSSNEKVEKLQIQSFGSF